MGEFVASSLTTDLDAILSSAHAVLIDGVLPANPTLLDVIRLELPQGDYTRGTYNSGNSTFDAAQNRAEKPVVNIPFTVPANGTTLSYNAIALISNTQATANASVSSLDDTNDRLVFSSNPFNNGDQVIVTAENGGTVPAQLISSPLFVVQRDSTRIRLSLTEGGTAIAFSGGTLPLRVRNANGRLRAIHDFGDSQQILPGNSRTYSLSVNLGISTANVTAP